MAERHWPSPLHVFCGRSKGPAEPWREQSPDCPGEQLAARVRWTLDFHLHVSLALTRCVSLFLCFLDPSIYSYFFLFALTYLWWRYFIFRMAASYLLLFLKQWGNITGCIVLMVWHKATSCYMQPHLDCAECSASAWGASLNYIQYYH